MTRHQAFGFLLFALLASASVSSQSLAAGSQPAGRPEIGNQLVQQRCVMCHGEAMILALSERRILEAGEELYGVFLQTHHVTTNDQDRADIIAYLRSRTGSQPVQP